MDQEQTFWLRIWQTFSTLAAVAIITTSGCVGYETSKVAEMVKSGADPIAARCAMGWTTSGSAPVICAVSSSKR